MQNLAQSVTKMLGLRLTPKQSKAFAKYEQELMEWNTRLSLTAIHEPEKIRVKHFLDSLTCLRVMSNTPMERIIDVGTGAGFPGLPLKIACPSIQLTLVESIGKKADFCRHVVQELQLENVVVLQDRAETLGKSEDYRERFDWAIARAVAIMPVLAEYLLPLARVGGKILAMKGTNAPAEIHQSEHAIRVLGGHLRRLVPVELPGVADERYLVVVDKIAATPERYPRRVGVPTKKPILL